MFRLLLKRDSKTSQNVFERKTAVHLLLFTEYASRSEQAVTCFPPLLFSYAKFDVPHTQQTMVYVYVYVIMYMCMYMCKVYSHAYAYVYVYVYMYVHVHVHVSVCVCIYM